MFIWHEQSIRPIEGFTIPARDRAFEHGLGLFETLRAERGVAPLLGRHLERLTRAAVALGIPLDPGRLPDADAVRSLVAANRIDAAALVRITITGGFDARAGSTLWMRAEPLAAKEPTPRVSVFVDSGVVAHSDPLARFKTLNYWSRRIWHERAVAFGCVDALVRSSDDGGFLEATRANLFVVDHGTLVTTSLDAAVVPGIARAVVLEIAARRGIETRLVESVPYEMLNQASEMFLTNAVRGVVPFGCCLGLSGAELRPVAFAHAPGPITARIASDIEHILNQAEPY